MRGVGSREEMQLRTLDEIGPGLELSRLLLHSAAFGVTTREHFEIYRKSGLLADYAAIFAVEGGEVIGQTIVFRFPYRFPDGAGTLAGIAAVTTRPDRARRHVAQRIFQEIHERERAAGVDHVALWTNSSWGAHRLYERLGYRDVWFPLTAARLVPKRGPSTRRSSIRWARRRDLRALDELHDRVCADRLGFAVHAGHGLAVDMDLGYLTPKEELRVYWKGSRPEGYASVSVSKARAECWELVAASTEARDALLADAERRARGKFLSLDCSSAADHEKALRARGYRVLRQGWYPFMGTSLRRRLTAKSAIAEFGTGDPRFVCFRSDRF
jgi:GNAT superfamily N-acetyltransferase